MLERLKKFFTESPMQRQGSFHEEQHAGSTRVLIKYNVGFKNNLYIRGHGPGLTWDRGVLLKNVGPDEWVWEPSTPIANCEFKVLINDEKYEQGENHRISGGKLFQYTPKF
jgi:hypothetical protein